MRGAIIGSAAVSDYAVEISRRKAEELTAALYAKGAITVDQVDAIGAEAQKIIAEALALAAQDRPRWH